MWKRRDPMSIGTSTGKYGKVREKWRECASRNCGNDVPWLLRISKSTEIRDGELHTYIIRFRAGSANIAAIPPVLILSFSLCLCLPPPFSPSLILLGPADGFPHAHVPRGRPGGIMNETRTEKGETEYVSRPSYSRFRPALAQARAITSIIEGVGCRKFYYHH